MILFSNIDYFKVIFSDSSKMITFRCLPAWYKAKSLLARYKLEPFVDRVQTMHPLDDEGRKYGIGQPTC